jgi:Hint module
VTNIEDVKVGDEVLAINDQGAS